MVFQLYRDNVILVLLVILEQEEKNGKQNKFNPNNKATPAHLQARYPDGNYEELHIDGSRFVFYRLNTRK
jgi:hypothetical protein